MRKIISPLAVKKIKVKKIKVGQSLPAKRCWQALPFFLGTPVSAPLSTWNSPTLSSAFAPGRVGSAPLSTWNGLRPLSARFAHRRLVAACGRRLIAEG